MGNRGGINNCQATLIYRDMNTPRMWHVQCICNYAQLLGQRKQRNQFAVILGIYE